jgi:glycosidase
MFLKTLLQWRQKTPAIHEGRLKHFIPENDVYVYFRFNSSQTIMVILNKSEDEVMLDSKRYNEFLQDFSSAIDVASGKEIRNLDQITIPERSPLILELVKKK